MVISKVGKRKKKDVPVPVKETLQVPETPKRLVHRKWLRLYCVQINSHTDYKTHSDKKKQYFFVFFFFDFLLQLRIHRKRSKKIRFYMCYICLSTVLH